MASSARIDGCLRDANLNAPTGFVLGGEWAVEYDWSNDRVSTAGSPKRLSDLGFPTGFDRDLDGALRGKGQFADFLYLFQGGGYARLKQQDMSVDGIELDLGNWGLPASWTTLDAVFPGGGSREPYAYFMRGDEYCRFDWQANAISPGYPKKVAQGFTITAPFTADIDGVVVGQGQFATKAYLFATATGTVDDTGSLAAGGSHHVSFPIYARYDFDTEQTEAQVSDPVDVVTNWNGLLPLFDGGIAVDIAIPWLTAASAGVTARLANLATPIAEVDSALDHHFHLAASVGTTGALAALGGRLGKLQQRLQQIPDKFGYQAALSNAGVAAETAPGAFTHIADPFSVREGPNGRAAQMIHEAVHFTYAGPPPPPPALVDIPEWSGATIKGQTFGTAPGGRTYASLTADEAPENPSSYASLAEEIFFHDDTRFGEGRPQE